MGTDLYPQEKLTPGKVEFEEAVRNFNKLNAVLQTICSISNSEIVNYYFWYCFSIIQTDCFENLVRGNHNKQENLFFNRLSEW
jgi:hypothetical protein